ncbi:MAG: ATP-grasp domain-containing protein [Pseudomonadota bacterium]
MTTAPTVLLTLGRLPPAVDISRSFARAGWRVLVAEPFRWHLARTSNAVAQSFIVPAPHNAPQAYGEALLDIIRRERVDLLLPVSEETMHVATLEAALPQHCQWFGSDARLIHELHSKFGFTRLARSAGLAVPETLYASAPESAELVMSGDTIVKPEYSCSGRRVQRISQGATLPTLAPGMLVQRAIDGDEYSAFAIAKNGEPLMIVVYRAVLRHGSVAVVFERLDQTAVTDWLATLIRSIHFTGFIAIDAIVDDAGNAYAIECNPRATSGIHFVAEQSLAALICGEASESTWRPQRRLQEFWSAWTHYLSVLGQPEQRRATWQAIRSARDVSWDRTDPWVFPLATFSTWPIIFRAIQRRATFAEVLALDIEWPPADET